MGHLSHMGKSGSLQQAVFQNTKIGRSFNFHYFPGSKGSGKIQYCQHALGCQFHPHSLDDTSASINISAYGLLLASPRP